MTVESIRDFLERFKAKVSYVKPTQTAEQIAQMLGYWHPPFGFIVDDQNLFDLFEDCLVAHHGYIDPMWLDTTCRESRGYLRWHQPPTEAPAPLPEPAPEPPKMVGTDSLGNAESAEHPIGVQPRADEAAQPNHALEDADLYFVHAGDRNKLQELRRQAWDEAPIVNGVRNLAAVAKRFNELRAAWEESKAPSKESDTYLQEVADKEYEHCRANGLTDSAEILRRVDNAVREAQARLKKK